MGSLMLLCTGLAVLPGVLRGAGSVEAPDGTPVDAVRRWLDMIRRLVRARHAARLVACWMRTGGLPSGSGRAPYKAHRLADGGEDTQALAAQVPLIEEVLRASGLAVAGQPGFEADDVIATLAARSPDPVDVVTGDRDLFQLVDDTRGIGDVDPVPGLFDVDVIDEAAMSAESGIRDAPSDFAALRGDPSDGLPGVPGVGEKTAAALIRAFGSVEGIVTALDAGHGGFPRGSREKLEKARGYLDIAMSVVRVVDNAPLPRVDGQLPADAAGRGPAEGTRRAVGTGLVPEPVRQRRGAVLGLE